MLTLRTATPEDVPQILAFIRDLAEYEREPEAAVATEDDINRRIFTLHSTQPIRIPLDPFPIKRTPIDKKVTEDDNDFGFQGTVVNAHSTLAGYLFYDIQDLDEPALKHAELYVKMVHTLDGKQQMFPFDIPFNKWLAAQPQPEKKN